MREDQTGPPGSDEPVPPDVPPEDAPRGGIAVPDTNDTGMTTSPIAGWGEIPVPEPDEPEEGE